MKYNSSSPELADFLNKRLFLLTGTGIHSCVVIGHSHNTSVLDGQVMTSHAFTVRDDKTGKSSLIDSYGEGVEVFTAARSIRETMVTNASSAIDSMLRELLTRVGHVEDAALVADVSQQTFTGQKVPALQDRVDQQTVVQPSVQTQPLDSGQELISFPDGSQVIVRLKTRPT